MKSKKFYRNERGQYQQRFYDKPIICLFIFFLVSIISFYFKRFALLIFLYLNFIFYVSILVILGLCCVGFYKVYLGLKDNKTIFKYISSIFIKKDIEKSLLSSMIVNLTKDNSTVIEVPGIKVIDRRPDIISIKIQKLSGMSASSIDKIAESINSSLTGKLQNYAVTSSILDTSGTFFEFVCEDMASDKTFRPKELRELVQKPYFIKLQEGLTINLSQLPHIAIWGQTGSGKTTVLFSILAQLLSSNSSIYLLDGKSEFSSFGSFYSKRKIVDNKEDMLTVLKKICTTITSRQKTVSEATKKRKKIGLTGYNLGLKPILIVGDELSSIEANMETKEKKLFISCLSQISQKGRSVSVFLILASQSPSTDVLPQKIRAQFSTKILLGSTNADIRRMAFGQNGILSDDIKKFRGFYTCVGKTNQPQHFFVPDFYFYGLASLDNFKKLYRQIF